MVKGAVRDSQGSSAYGLPNGRSGDFPIRGRVKSRLLIGAE